MPLTLISSSRGRWSRDLHFIPRYIGLRRMLIPKLQRLIRENNKLREEIQYLNSERNADALVDSLRRDENEQLLTMLGEETTRYAPVPHQLMTMLHEAAEAGDINQVRATLEQISGIESTSPQKETA